MPYYIYIYVKKKKKIPKYCHTPHISTYLIFRVNVTK